MLTGLPRSRCPLPKSQGSPHPHDDVGADEQYAIRRLARNPVALFLVEQGLQHSRVSILDAAVGRSSSGSTLAWLLRASPPARRPRAPPATQLSRASPPPRPMTSSRTAPRPPRSWRRGQTAAAATVAQTAADAATVQQEQLARYRQALAADDEAAAHEARNEMWKALAALFSRTMELAAAWNDFAAPQRGSGSGGSDRTMSASRSGSRVRRHRPGPPPAQPQHAAGPVRGGGSVPHLTERSRRRRAPLPRAAPPHRLPGTAGGGPGRGPVLSHRPQDRGRRRRPGGGQAPVHQGDPRDLRPRLGQLGAGGEGQKVLGYRGSEYVLATQAVGAGPWRIVTRHLLPGSLSHIIVVATLSVPGLILGESAPVRAP